MYLTATRPDIMHTVRVISRYMECPTEIHLLAAKRICRYLQGTKEFGLFYKNGEKSNLFGFTDSDYARDSDDRKSTSGYVFMMGTGVVSWSSKKQPIVTLSSTKTEFVAATACACQAIWLKKILKELHFKEDGPTQIYCDNSSAINSVSVDDNVTKGCFFDDHETAPVPIMKTYPDVLFRSNFTWSKQTYRCKVSFLEGSHE